MGFVNLVFPAMVMSTETSQGPLEGDCTRFAYEYRILQKLILLEQENKEFKVRLEKLEQGNKGTNVAVKVRLSKNQNLGQHGRIMFDGVISNIGNAYNLEKGQFVAPVAGIYMVIVQVCLSQMAQWIYLDIINDGAIIGRVFSANANSHNCGSEAVSLSMDQGSAIWVIRVGGSATILNQDLGWNSFTAVLVQHSA